MNATYPPPFETHDLKTWAEYFEAIIKGVKPFDIRRDDRNFKVGDTLLLREFIPCIACAGAGFEKHDDGQGNYGFCNCSLCHGEKGRYTGRWLTRRIAYKTDYAQRDGYAVLGIPAVILSEKAQQ